MDEIEPFPSVKRIGILGHVGNANLGDEGIITAVIQNIQRRSPGAELCAFTTNPHDTRERHGIPAFPLRRLTEASSSMLRAQDIARGYQSKKRMTSRDALLARLKAIPLVYALLKHAQKGVRVVFDSLREIGFLVTCFGNLGGLDILIVAGSAQLFDYFGGAWGFPYTLLKWSVLAKVRRIRLVFLSVGAGPINSDLSRFFLRCSLLLANYRSYRDDSSRRLIESIGVAGPDPVFPDMAFSLDTAIPGRSRHSGNARIVGMNPMPFFALHYWPERDPNIYQAYVEKLADFGLWLIGHGHKVLLFPTQLRADPVVINDIIARMVAVGPPDVQEHLISQPIGTFEDLLSQISLTDIVIATRFHAVVFSYLMRKPVLAIYYHHKTADLMRDLGQSDYLLDINHFDLASLIGRFTALQAKAKTIAQEVDHRIEAYRSALARQYDTLLGGQKDTADAADREARHLDGGHVSRITS